VAYSRRWSRRIAIRRDVQLEPTGPHRPSVLVRPPQGGRPRKSARFARETDFHRGRTEPHASRSQSCPWTVPCITPACSSRTQALACQAGQMSSASSRENSPESVSRRHHDEGEIGVSERSQVDPHGTRGEPALFRSSRRRRRARSGYEVGRRPVGLRCCRCGDQCSSTYQPAARSAG